jgi:hypothetical protein
MHVVFCSVDQHVRMEGPLCHWYTRESLQCRLYMSHVPYPGMGGIQGMAPLQALVAMHCNVGEGQACLAPTTLDQELCPCYMQCMPWAVVWMCWR